MTSNPGKLWYFCIRPGDPKRGSSHDSLPWHRDQVPLAYHPQVSHFGTNFGIKEKSSIHSELMLFIRLTIYYICHLYFPPTIINWLQWASQFCIVLRYLAMTLGWGGDRILPIHSKDSGQKMRRHDQRRDQRQDVENLLWLEGWRWVKWFDLWKRLGEKGNMCPTNSPKLVNKTETGFWVGFNGLCV